MSILPGSRILNDTLALHTYVFYSDRNAHVLTQPMRFNFKRDGRRSTLQIHGILVELCLTKYKTVESLRGRVKLLAEVTPEGEMPTAWVRDQLLLEVARPDLVLKLGDKHTQTRLPFKGFIHV